MWLSYRKSINQQSTYTLQIYSSYTLSDRAGGLERKMDAE